MNHPLSITLFLTVLFCACQPHAATPTYQVYKTDQPLTLDGKPTEPIWSKADSSMSLALIAGHGVPGADERAAKIWAKALFDSTKLYLYLWVDEKYLWDSTSGYDAWLLWTQKVVEVFIDDSGDDKNFAEFNFGINGAIGDFLDRQKYYCSAVAAPNSDPWNCVFKYNAHPQVGIFARGTVCNTGNPAAACNTDIDTGFGMEIAIPLDSLKSFGPSGGKVDVLGPKFHIPPRNLESLWVNLYYTGCNPGTNNQLFWDWSTAAGIDFHNTREYGTFIFIDTVARGISNAIKPSGTPSVTPVVNNSVFLNASLVHAFLAANSALSAQLFDIHGRLICAAGSEPDMPGKFSAIRNLPNGTYLLRMQTQQSCISQKIVIGP